jgi:hypothetical protein
MILNKANYYTRILSIDDNSFIKLVEILKQSQGNELRQFSYASSGMVNSIICGRMNGLALFPIENVESNQITSLPKNSDILLQLITGIIL